MYKLIDTNYLHIQKYNLQYWFTYFHMLQLHLYLFQSFMPFLNLDTFSALFIVSRMAIQRMPPRNPCYEFPAIPSNQSLTQFFNY